MTRLAHLTDLHLLEPGAQRRTGAARARLGFLCLGRAKNPGRRRLRAAHALRSTRDSGADHLLLTGDLTEDGAPEQFEVLAEILHESGWRAAQVTLVPGNHDLYSDGDAWTRALDGPLRPWRATSAPGAVLPLADMTLVAVCSARPQAFALAGGAIQPHELSLLRRLAVETRRTGRPMLIAQHHPPRHALRALWPLDGLREQTALLELLEREDHVYVVHGHTHAARDLSVRPGGADRLFSAEAVIDSPASLRTYHVRYGRIWPEPQPAHLRAASMALA